MIHVKALFTTASLLLLAQVAESPLRFAPEKDSSWTKTYKSTTEIDGGDLSVVMDGEEIPSEFLPQLDMTMASENAVTLTDVYAGTADGRPLALQRTYNSVESSVMQSMDMGGFEGTEAEELELSGASALAGETLDIVWDPEESAYSISFAEDSEADPALTERLVEDTDLRALLPEVDVAEGDTWTCDAAALSSVLLAPGGDLSIVYEGDGADDYNQPLLETAVTGEVELKYTGQREVEGRTVGVVEIEAKVNVRTVHEASLDRVPTVDGAATETVTNEYELGGELLWDVEAGYLVALDLEGDVLVEVKLVRDPDEPGPTFQSAIQLDGKATFEVRAERSE